MVMVVMMEVLVVIALNSDDGSKDDDGGSDDGDGSDDGGPGGRLLARVLKEGVQFWYNDTSTVKRGGLRKHSSGKPLKFALLHVCICSKLVRNVSNTLGFVSLCRYESLLNYDIFIQPGTPSN